jgi:NitT/TauT family transport system permease protein
MHKRKNRLKNNIPVLITFIIIIAGWELIDFLFKIKEIILPNPHEILFTIINNLGELLSHTYVTLLESILGFIVGSVSAILLAILFVYSATSKKALYPYIIAIKAAPLYALAPLLLLWFGNGIMSKVVMSALVAFFPVLVNAVKGFTAVEPEAVDLFKSLSASKWQVFFKLRFPSSLKYIFPALKIASTFAVVGATIAEFTGASKGIGYLIVNSSYYLETSMMFAGILMISLVGILLFYLIEFLEKKVVFWEVHENEQKV